MIGPGGAAGRAHLCRDCLVETPGEPPTRCPHCGSPRLVGYAAGADLTIAHIDCDAFYAAIEKRDNPHLRDRPLIVGGGRRGVVSTCCYIARTFGVRSAMPMFQALKLCPQAAVVPPDMARYAQVGRQIRTLMQTLTPLVEPVSIDEAFLDLAGCQGVHGAVAPVTLARFAQTIESRDRRDHFDRPQLLQISRQARFGPRQAARLFDRRAGRGDGAAGAAADQPDLGGRQGRAEPPQRGGPAPDRRRADSRDLATMLARHGAEGGRLWRLARGIDERRVTPLRETKSVSSETTFDNDSADKEHLTRALLIQCERVAVRLKKQQLACRSVTLKLRTADFQLRTRRRSGFEPTQLATRLFLVARALLEKELDGTRFRLLGVSTADFAAADAADRADLVDKDIGREKAREQAIDSAARKVWRRRGGSRSGLQDVDAEAALSGRLEPSLLARRRRQQFELASIGPPAKRSP